MFWVFRPADYDSEQGTGRYDSDSDFDSDGSGSSMGSGGGIGGTSATRRRILFCSRTHSQLSQFVQEVRRTKFGKDIPSVALGSRKQLCVNESVRRLGGSTAINEKCLDLQNNKSKAKKKENSDKPPSKSSCPYYDKSSVKRVRDLVLYEAQDIESVHLISKEMRTCGYYAARAAVDEAELICLPYSMLLQKRSREALGIDIKGSVVICDEAHNLIEAINQTYSISIDVESISQAKKELEEYKSRYASRLKAKNKLYISHLIYVTAGLAKFLATLSKAKKQNKGNHHDNAEAKSVPFQLLTPGELLLKAKVDHVNLFKLVRYIKLSKLNHKLRGFAAKFLSPNEVEVHKKGQENPRPRSSLQTVSNFLDALLNADANGKILVMPSEGKLKFLMLNAAVHFQEIVDDAHAVVLAGGTMQPTNDVVSQLFGHLQPEDITLFSCGHVIPKSNMLCSVVSSGPCSIPIELTYQNRSDARVMDEIGRAICSICKVVPSGVVVFFPSYRYEEELTGRWQRTGMLKTLQLRKQLFREQRSGKQPLERLLSDYAAGCRTVERNRNGAVLFSVVGGKLSEGINFKDDLARCVIMVGLPFPNRSDPELQVKMNYLDKAKYSSKEFYENQCMKAVNQCIGRSIRHKNDYASVVLLDTRYKRPSIAEKLPKWIARDMLTPDKFGPVYRALHQYFKAKQQ